MVPVMNYLKLNKHNTLCASHQCICNAKVYMQEENLYNSISQYIYDISMYLRIHLKRQVVCLQQLMRKDHICVLAIVYHVFHDLLCQSSFAFFCRDPVLKSFASHNWSACKEQSLRSLTLYVYETIKYLRNLNLWHECVFVAQLSLMQGHGKRDQPHNSL